MYFAWHAVCVCVLELQNCCLLLCRRQTLNRIFFWQEMSVHVCACARVPQRACELLTVCVCVSVLLDQLTCIGLPWNWMQTCK